MNAGATREGWVDQHGLAVLDRADCLRRLDDAAYGRLAFPHNERCLVLPVVHVLEYERIAFRSSIGTKIQSAAVGRNATFQVDDYDPESGTGWSVLAWGRLEIVRDPEALRRLEDAPVPSVVTGAKQGRWVALAIEDVSGRALRQS